MVNFTGMFKTGTFQTTNGFGRRRPATRFCSKPYRRQFLIISDNLTEATCSKARQLKHHTARKTSNKFEESDDVKVLPYVAYSPNVDSSDYGLFRPI